MYYQTDDGRPSNPTFLFGHLAPGNPGCYIALNDSAPNDGKLSFIYGNPTNGSITKITDYLSFGDNFQGATLLRFVCDPPNNVMEIYINEKHYPSSYSTSGGGLSAISSIVPANYSGPNNIYVNTINNNGSAHSNNALGSMLDFAITPLLTAEEAADVTAYFLTSWVNIDLGQSNSEGQAEAARMATSIAGSTAYPRTKAGCFVYPKTTRTSADDGAWQALNAGTNTKGPDILAGSFDTCADETPLLQKLYDKTKQPVFWIKTSRGGSRLEPDGGALDWAVSTNELYLQATQYWWTVAKNKLLTYFPSMRIKPIIHWHQGESDANDATARANYLTNLTTLITALRAYDPLLKFAPLFITKLYFDLTANETTINNALAAYVAANENTYLINIDDQPRKVDLTVPQKGGISPTTSGGDDNHTSYLGQIAKGERKYQKLIDIQYF